VFRRCAHALIPLVVISASARGQTKSNVDLYLSPAFPSELVSAKTVDRIAWLSYERGRRNVYAAAAPEFTPVRLTKFLDDDGVTLSDLSISDDGNIVTFVRGSEPNLWNRNVSSR
jgi:hypothetical protein